MTDREQCDRWIEMGTHRLSCDLPAYHESHQHHTTSVTMAGRKINLTWELEMLSVGELHV